MGRATTFLGVIALIEKIEKLLIAKALQNDVVDRIITLRGIFYGTTWSLDYLVESKRSIPGAMIRNAGFLTYTGHSPADPTLALAGTTLLKDLQDSQSMHDGPYGLDIGHTLIGLETRGRLITRSVPFPGQGGTGLEIVTWLGDLGGGAANLAKRRVVAPATSVRVIFENSTSDYGVMDNLEGDVGAYIVASGGTAGGPQVVTSSTTVADIFRNYLPVSRAHKDWDTRAAEFSKALGGTLSSRGITNKSTVIAKLTAQLFDFAVWYAATRWVHTGELTGKKATDACRHMKGAAEEVATVFVETLSKSVAHPRLPIKASAPYPAPKPPEATCSSTLLNTASTNPGEIRRDGEKKIEEWYKKLKDFGL
jgi:hypothetical protein